MRVAVVGANLLGSASAFYVRRALDANRAEAASVQEDSVGVSSEANASANHKGPRPPEGCDEIVVFERLSRAGGNKFAVLELCGVKAAAGTASGVDVANSPALSALMKDSGFAMPQKPARREWAVFDWDADEYKVGQVYSRILHKVMKWWVLLLPVQLCLLASAALFVQRLRTYGLGAFYILKRNKEQVANTRDVIWFICTVLLGCGVIPMRLVLRAYDALYFRSVASVTAGMTYGGHSISVLSTLMSEMRSHQELIVAKNAATSCVTTGHLLSACGLGKYARASTSEFLSKFQVRQPTIDDCVAPGLAHAYGNSKVLPDGSTNALATLFSMLTRCPMPPHFRSSAKYLNAEDTANICPHILAAAKAEVKYGVEIQSVKSSSKARYELFGRSDTGEAKSRGHFDAVILAAVVDPEIFSADVPGTPLVDLLSLAPSLASAAEVRSDGMNTAKYTSLIIGEINADYFNKSSASAVADHVFVLNSVNCSQVVKVCDGAYLVSSHEKPEKGSSVLTSVFKSVSGTLTIEATKRHYHPSPMRDLDGTSSPALILDTRFLNAACVDRVANDANLDCLSARNTASFFRDGVATWK